MYSLELEQKQIKRILGGIPAPLFKLEDLIHRAYHDSLTGLPNRHFLKQSFQDALKHAKRDYKKLAVLYLDLDNFKNINDSFGHKAGDAVLKTVAGSLRDTVRETDLIARIGGDEFVVVAEIDSESDITKLTQRIFEAMHVSGYKGVRLGLSIGVALYPDHGVNRDTLLERADEAMYEAKRHGKNKLHIYNSGKQ